MKLAFTTLVGIAVVAGLGCTATASVLEFDNKKEWAAAVDGFLTVDFTGFALGTTITTQYAELGIALTDANDMVVCCSENAFPQDGAGLDGNGTITVVFDAPQSWIAADFPGFLWFQLFSAGQLIYTSGLFGVGGIGNFGGLVSLLPFDKAVLIDFNETSIDDLHFGGPVAAPSGLALLGLATLGTGRKRRRGTPARAWNATAAARRFKSHVPLAAVTALVLAASPCTAQTACDPDMLLAPDGAELDEFGSAVAISGDIVVAGARQDDESAANVGSAYIFRFDPGTAAWLLDQKLFAGDGALSDWFGYAVAVAGERVIVGAPYHNQAGSDAGAVYVYRDTKSGWVPEQKILAPDAAPGDDFGWALAIDAGPPARIVVAAPFDDDDGFNSGSVYVFRLDESGWALEEKLLPADGAMLDNFGVSVAIDGSAQSPRIVVGAYNDDDLGYDSGAAYVFRHDSDTSSWIQEQKILAADGESDNQFGSAVSLSGVTALIAGAWDDDNGENAGSAYTFGFDGTHWVQQQKLLAADGQPLDFFGLSVALSGHTAVIGASLDDDNGNLAGAAYVFGFNGSSWVQRQKLLRPGGFNTEEFGSAVAISGDGWGRIAIGALWAHEVVLFQGAVHVFDLAPGPGDLDCNGTIGVTDLLTLLASWGVCAGCPADLNGDGMVGVVDFLTLLSNWGP